MDKTPEQIQSILKRLDRIERVLFREKTAATPPTSEMSFEMDERAFFQKHAKGLKGPQVFTLVLAWLAKGKIDIAVTLEDVKKTWMRVKGLMPGNFYSIYTTRARGMGFVRSSEKEQYVLTPRWIDILKVEKE